MDQDLMEQLPNNATIELTDGNLRGSEYNATDPSSSTEDSTSSAEISPSVMMLVLTFAFCIIIALHKLQKIQQND